jgi:hypothetical protein
MVKIEQQQQQQADQGSDDQQHLDQLLTTLLNVLGATAVSTRSAQMDAAWRDVARPTAATLEHTMHVRLVQQQHDADVADGDSVSFWQSFMGMLWSDKNAFGPLLMVSVDEAAAAAAAAAAEPADVSGAVDTAAASQPTAPQLFSLCISAVKVLSRRAESPYVAMEDHETSMACTAQFVLEHVQQTADAMLTHSIPSEPLEDGEQRSFCSVAAGAPWAVLLLRCVQLGASWLQLVTPSLLQGLQGSSSSSSSSTSGQPQQGLSWPQRVMARLAPVAAQQQQQSEAHNELQEMLGDAAKSVRQMADGLYVLKLALARWCAAAAPAEAAAAHPAAGGEPAAAGVLLPLLQQHHQQLQQELLPAAEEVLQLWEADNASSNSSSQGEDQEESITEMMQSLGVLSAWNFSLKRDNYESFVRWQAADGAAAGSSAAGDESDDEADAEADQDYQHLVGHGIWCSQPEQQCEALEGLQQFLDSGRLQSWLAAASSALPLRWCCNNPGCSNLGTAGSKARGSELRRVNARQCSSCQSVCYCSKVSVVLPLSRPCRPRICTQPIDVRHTRQAPVQGSMWLCALLCHSKLLLKCMPRSA